MGKRPGKLRYIEIESKYEREVTLNFGRVLQER